MKSPFTGSGWQTWKKNYKVTAHIFSFSFVSWELEIRVWMHYFLRTVLKQHVTVSSSLWVIPKDDMTNVWDHKIPVILCVYTSVPWSRFSHTKNTNTRSPFSLLDSSLEYLQNRVLFCKEEWGRSCFEKSTINIKVGSFIILVFKYQLDIYISVAHDSHQILLNWTDTSTYHFSDFKNLWVKTILFSSAGAEHDITWVVVVHVVWLNCNHFCF